MPTRMHEIRSRTLMLRSLYMPLMCEHEHTVSHVQKIANYDHKYTHTRNFTHAHDTVGFQHYVMPKCVHVCSKWVLLGKAEATVELVCWCWVSMRQ